MRSLFRRIVARRRDFLMAAGLASAALAGAWLCVRLVPPALGAPAPGGAVAARSRVGDQIAGREVEDLIFRELADRGYRGELMITINDLPATWSYLPEETGYRLTSPSHEPRTGAVSYYLEILSGAATGRIVPLTAWVRLYRQQVVTARPVERGQTLDASDMKLDRVEVNTNADPGYDAVADCVGLRARRTLPAEWTLITRDVERVPAVLRGQRLPVVYRMAGLSIRATVEVKADGWVGDAVPVMNVDSRRGFTARVTGPGQIIVEGLRS